MAFAVNAQSLGEYKPSVNKYGLNKLKKAPKKIFIYSFNVNFEVYKEAVDFKQGSSQFGGGYSGDATARAAVGLEGIDFSLIQEKTNLLYQEYLELLKSKGLEIINPDDAKNIEAFEGWEEVGGPYLGEVGIPGVLLCVPDGFKTFIKGVKKSGKTKKGMLQDNFLPATLSKQLDDAIIANVNLYVMYSEAGGDWMKGNAAKVKIFTNFRVVGDYAVVAPADKSILKGAQSVDNVVTGINYSQGKQGLGAPVGYNGGLKKPLEINGVMKKEKIVAYQKQSTTVPTSFSNTGAFVLTEDRFSKNATWITVDPSKYADGLYMACKKVMLEHSNAFLSNL